MVSDTNASDVAGQPSDRRKLIVVVHADVVGYSRLIGLDDIGTLDRMRRLRREVIDPAIDAYGGRVVNTSGDGLLVVFDSVDGAVRSALRVQRQVPVVEGDVPSDQSIRFRIGINVGDVIPDGTDVHGDVVNVAARLQAECSPGGICVSRAVRDHIHGRLDIAFEPLGSLNLKNIAHPVEAFMSMVDATIERSLLQGAETLPLPDKPSIAVLAFTNMSDDPEQEYFSDGIADDIITELSRSSSLFVIARNSSFTYKSRATDIKQVGHELGVRYVLEGSVRRGGERVRVNAQLIDAETGNHIWADRYGRDLTDVFAVQDEITVAATTAILPAVMDAEQRRALRKPPENLGAWEAYQRGLWHARKATAADNEQALQFFRRSIKLDPTFASPHAMLAHHYGWGFASGRLLPVDEISNVAEREARCAIELDPKDAVALGALSWLSVCEGDPRSALELAERAISAAPNDTVAWLAMARVQQFSGRPHEAVVANKTALRLSPVGPSNWIILMGLIISNYFAREYGAAVGEAQHTIRIYPEITSPYRWLAAGLGQLGRQDAAQAALRKAIEASPASFAFYTESRPPWFRPEDHEHMLDGLRKAGWEG